MLPAATGRHSAVASLEAGPCQACMKQPPTDCGREPGTGASFRQPAIGRQMTPARPDRLQKNHPHPPLDSLAATLPLTPPRASTDGAPPRLLAVLLEPTWTTGHHRHLIVRFQDPLVHSFLPRQRLTVPFGRIALQSRPLVRPHRQSRTTTTPRNDALPVPRGPLRARPPLAGIPAPRRAPSPICAAPSFMNLRFPGAREAGSHHVERK
jgi:hypothetical protein